MLGTPYTRFTHYTLNHTAEPEEDVIKYICGAAKTLTLPVAAQCKDSEQVRFVINDITSTFNLTVAVQSGDTAVGNLTLLPGRGVFCISDGAATWYMVGASGAGAGTVSEADLSFTDLTTADATSAAHGLMPKLTPGVATASQPVTLGSNKNLDVLVLPASGLKIGAGAGTAMDATAAELNKNASVVAGTASASKTAVLGSTKNIDTILFDTALQIKATGKLGITPKTNDTYGAAMTIDVAISNHVVAAANGTSAACTMTPSAAGSAGDWLFIDTVADASGTVTVTFASTFHSSGTQATTASHFSSIAFKSDGTRWIEQYRTTNLA